MNELATTIACPECGHGARAPELNTVLGFLEDPETGFLVGHRLYCRKCEHYWTDWLSSAGRTA